MIHDIPIKNIYYLLCYAWNKLDERDKVNVSIDDKTKLLDLFAKILINATKILLKRGIAKDYKNDEDVITGIRGKILLSNTIKHNLLIKQMVSCSIDDFTSNIVLNRILISTIQRLVNTQNLDKLLKNDLIFLKRMFYDIQPIELSKKLFNQINLNRNNQFYGFLIDVCQIIYENTLPSESEGYFKFTDFTKDEGKMNQLFEAFIRNFYKIEQNKYAVKREIITWNFDSSEELSFQYLPQMGTDITLENDFEKVIIDAKFYRETMTTYFNKEKLKSSNLYQLFSYLLNQQDGSKKTLGTKGILIYPTVLMDYNLNYKYQEHEILIRSLNLNIDWKGIEKRLLEIVNVDSTAY